jgi:hypothetical protein
VFRSLERALVQTLLAHAATAFATATILGFYLPGAIEGDDLTRVTRLAHHPWVFRFTAMGWIWCAFAQTNVAWSLVRLRARVGAVAFAAFALSCVGALVDTATWLGWMSTGVDLARPVAAGRGSLDAFLAWERHQLVATAGFAGTAHTLAFIAQAWCLGRLVAVPRVLTGATAALMLPVALASCRVSVHASWPRVIGGVHGVGFALLLAWMAVTIERVLRVHRPEHAWGRLARWKHPSRAVVGRVADVIANSRLVSALIEPLPIAAMVSDIREVVYVNYLVEAEKVIGMVPEGLELQRLGEGGRWALLSFLTYRHGHFGFRFMGPLRRLTPSSVQTNWRVHVREARTGVIGITFITNAIDHTFQALAARLFTEGMPMHVLARATLERDSATGRVHVELDPGEGSAPRATLDLKPCEAPVFEGEWAECFKDFRALLEYCVPQNRAMSAEPWLGRVTRHEIHLPIALDDCQPLAGEVRSSSVEAIVGGARPVCFRVAGLRFVFEEEIHDPLPID